MSDETADDVRDEIRRALNDAKTHAELLRMVMAIAYPSAFDPDPETRVERERAARQRRRDEDRRYRGD